TRSTETSEELASIQVQLNNLGREIKKVNEKVYVVQVEREQCKGPHYTKDFPLKKEGASVSVMPLLTYLNLGLDFIILDMPEDVKVPMIFGRPFLSTAHANIDIFKRKITLRVGDEKIIFKSMKPASSLIKRVYMLSLREQMELDLEVRLMEETLVLNRSLDPLYGDYIELSDLNVPLELMRNQVDDLMPTIEEVVEDMDLYLDDGMGEVVVGTPFWKVLYVETKRFLYDVFQFMDTAYWSPIQFRLFVTNLRAASLWLRNKPSSLITTWEDQKTKFISKYCPLARTAKKMEEINNFQQEPHETVYQVWERFKKLLMKCPQHYITEMQEAILFYNGLEVPTQQILDSKGAIPSKTAIDAKVAIQEMTEYSQKWHNETSRTRSTETSDELASIQVQLNNLGREIKKVNENVYVVQVECEQCKGPHYTKDFLLKKEGASVSVMPLLTYLNLGLDFIILDMPEDVKVPMILGRPFLSTAHANIDIFKRKITLRVEDEKIIFKSMKPASSLIKRVYMLSLREQMELDLEVRLMEETLVLNRSLDPLYRDYIELNDLNVPLELMRNQVDDLMPTIEKVVEDMDLYLDDGMGEVVVETPFCKVLYVETKRFDGIILSTTILSIRRVHAHDTVYLAD
nr:hypothetical protein [Tanacetum cinerariifolium]